jgi:hypothetical protein
VVGMLVLLLVKRVTYKEADGDGGL